MGTWATVGYAAGTAGASAATSTASVSTTNSVIDGKNFSQTSKQALKDTTSKDSLENIAIAATTAALAVGASQVANVTNVTNTTVSTVERVATNLSTGLQKASIYSTSNILATSAIKGQSIDETIEQRGGGEKILLNSAISALAEAGAKEIGVLAHGTVNSSGNVIPQIDKATQLTLHGVLGASISAISGNDTMAGILSGAAAAVAGEVAGDVARNNDINKGAGVAIAQTAGALSSLTTSVVMGEGDDDTAKNVGIGARIGANAAANNAYFGERRLDTDNKILKKVAPIGFEISKNSSILDNKNIKLAHEQLFFEDSQGGNLGYFEDGKVKPENPILLDLYKSTLAGFDDSLMREAVKNVQPKPYSLLGAESCKYNCQDWATDVRAEYRQLQNERNLKIWNQLIQPQSNLNEKK